MIVADRPLLGYPDTQIEIHMDFSPEQYRVVITDPCGVLEWEAADRREALDKFKHPFAYGYTYNTSNIDDED